MSAYLQSLKQNRFLPGPRIVNLYRIEGTLTTKTPLHIGSGRIKETEGKEGEALPRLLLIRDHHGRPVIPGSSLRGAIRSWIEAMLLPFNTPGHYDVASLSAGEFDFQRGLTQQELERQRLEIIQAVDSKIEAGKIAQQHRTIEIEDCMTAYYLENLDLVAGLFGHGRFHSRVDFENATLIGNSNDCTMTMPGVTIDRTTGAAKKGHLFEVEAVKPQCKFQVAITLRNVALWEVGLVLVAMEAFNDPDFPLRLGGHEGTDYGRVTWELKSIKRFGGEDRPLGPEEALSQWRAWCTKGHEGAKSENEIANKAKEALGEVLENLVPEAQQLLKQAAPGGQSPADPSEQQGG
jgi:CRISPR-associated RAMP protein (TIGR02581 family)